MSRHILSIPSVSLALLRTGLASIVFVSSLLTACQPASPPFECTDAIGCVDIAPGEAVKLGVIQDLWRGSATRYRACPGPAG
jgi:hypothetical protein